MFKQLIVVWLIVAAAIAITAELVPSVEIDGGFFALLGVALIFGLVNGLIGPVLRLLTLPLTLVTFGLFALVVNGVLLALTAGLSDNLDVGGFFAVVVAAFLISIISSALGFAVTKPSRDTEDLALGQTRLESLFAAAWLGCGAASTSRTNSNTAITMTKVRAVRPVGWSCNR